MATARVPLGRTGELDFPHVAEWRLEDVRSRVVRQIAELNLCGCPLSISPHHFQSSLGTQHCSTDDGLPSRPERLEDLLLDRFGVRLRVDRQLEAVRRI